MSKRNFDNLEVGKSYVSNDAWDAPVKMRMKGTSESFLGSNSSWYKANGIIMGDPDGHDLTTEVTVTITPVEPKRPREYWLGLAGHAVEQTFNNENEAKEWVYFCPPKSYRSFIHVREVMEGEE